MDEIALHRTLLYLPASNPRAVAKARTLAADVVILDLEDAVAPAAKADARSAAVAAVREGGWGHRAVLIRVNALVTPWSEEDFAAVAGLAGLAGPTGGAGLAGVVVPKVADAADATVAVSRAGGLPVWAMIETPAGVLAADRIAATEGVVALIVGTNDLAADLRARPGSDRATLTYSLARIVLAARAAGILAFDGVFAGIDDADGVHAEAGQGLAFGFDGKSVIHPGQIAPVNAVFSPAAADVIAARALIASHDAAVAEGRGVVAHDGRMIEALHVDGARRLVTLAAAIAARG